ncbi:MAG: DNA topoisomerase subunit B [Eubacteriales bacterium]|nr:DNA topoisomerase subunit B [Eubacteriales bacterium]
MANTYAAGDIKVLEGLDAVRMRPGMYIGSTGSRGLHHMLWEIVDNAIDEAMGGFADTVTVTIHPDNSVTVTDNGRGIPVDIHPKLKVPGVQVVYTQLHAGGKFDHNSYQFSGGLHGVGASVVNALSSWLVVEVHKDGIIYRQRYESVRTGKRVQAGKPVTPLEQVGKTFEHGTRVTYLPDSDVFESLALNTETVSKRLKELAFLNRGLFIRFSDERVAGFVPVEYRYEGGIADFVKYLNEEKTPLHAEPLVFEGFAQDMEIAVAIQYTDTYTESLFSYVNNIPTTEGGTHETGFKSALTKVVNEYARKNNILKGKDDNLSGEDCREGMTAVLALKIREVQFEGQTKTRLGNSEARPAVETATVERLGALFNDLRNADTVNAIVEKAVKAAQVRAAARKAKDLARKKSGLESAPLVGKLSSCIGRKPEENELFIVEGDSAGGSAKQGRDRKFQAILPLRGKPLNAERKRLDAVLQNEEFRSIITALGTNIDEDFDVTSLKYHKVIILSDADQDGAHIRAILSTFFFRYMKPLITEGHLYIGQPPLYKVSRGSVVKYAYDDKELAKATENMGRGYSLQRFKGLGEMNPEQLWETTLSPEHRKLVRVTIEDAADAERMVTILMGDKVEPRRDYISQYAYFNRQDNFAGNPTQE